MKRAKAPQSNDSGKSPSEEIDTSPSKRPRKVTAQEGAERKLRKLLTTDVDFLVEPQSEYALRTELKEEGGVTESALREALAAFLNRGSLESTGQGIRRPRLEVPDVIVRFQERLSFEKIAIMRRHAVNPSMRAGASGALVGIAAQQAKLAASNDLDDRVQWFCLSVEFHSSLLRHAGIGELVTDLQNLMWRIRFAARFPLEDAQTRESVAKDHMRIAKELLTVDDWDRYWSMHKNEHIKKPLGRALKQLFSIDDVEPYWAMTLELAGEQS